MIGSIWIRRATDESHAIATFNPFNAKWLDQSSDHIYLDIKCTNPSNLSSDSGIDIWADDDTARWRIDDLTQMSSHDEGGKSITSAWQSFEIPLSLFSTIGSAGDPDIRALQNVSVWGTASTGTIVLFMRNVKIDATDTCSKTLVECKRHNNHARFGAFPGVPTRRVSRG